MTAARFAISLDARLARAVRRSAGDQPVSTWIADAAQRKLRAEGLLAVVGEWEAAHGDLGPGATSAAKKTATRKSSRRTKRASEGK
jgi:hypothetical protein